MLMDIIRARHSIRKYQDEQIKREGLEKILEAGNYVSKEQFSVSDCGCFLHEGFVILGYIRGEQPHSKPRKTGRIKIIE